MRMPRGLRRLLVVPTIAMMMTVTSWAVGSAAQAATILQAYSVTISGTASGNPFTRTGTLIVATTVTRATTNGVNPVEVCLNSGTPAASPDAGAIRFNSNSACISSRATLDLTFVSVSGGTVTVTPDSRIAATGGNVFTTRRSITACPYFPSAGSARYTFFTNNTVSGTIRITGYGGAFCGSSTYAATVTGRRIA